MIDIAETAENIEDILTPKQERFCRNYTQNKVFFGNGTLSYADAYGYELDDEEKFPKNDAVFLLSDGTEVKEWEYDLMDSDEDSIKIKRTVTKSSYDRAYSYCSVAGSKMVANYKIQERCRQMLNDFLNDPVIDARLIEIILKGADGDSIRAIQEYNKLKQRIITKIDHTSKGNEIKGNVIVFKDYGTPEYDEEDIETNGDIEETETRGE